MRSLQFYILTLAATAPLACVAPQRSYQFTVPHGTDIDNTQEATTRALTDEGHPPAAVEGELITTVWEETGQSDGTLEGKPATLLRRFRINVAKGPSADDLTVEMDLRRCASGAYKIHETELSGTCEPKDLSPAEERAIDVLGGRLKETLAGGR
jgi:hypothetical protein